MTEPPAPSGRLYSAVTKYWPCIAAGLVIAVGMIELVIGGLTADSGIEFYLLTATHTVPGDFATIQAAHDAATSGDTILVAPGTYSGQITITKAITLASHFVTTGDQSNIATTILDGGGAAFVIEIPSGAEDGATIEGFTIQNADDGITPRAHFNLLNCVVTDTSDGVGYEDGSGGLVQFCTFELNSDDGLAVVSPKSHWLCSPS